LGSAVACLARPQLRPSLVQFRPLSAGCLSAFLWSLKTGQYDDLDGATWRAIIDDDASVAAVDRPVDRSTERRSSKGAVSSRIDLRQLRGKDLRYRLMMSPDDLVEKCNEAMRLGVDFPTLWHTIIKCDPNVMGPPVQRLEGNRTYLEIALLRGDWLVIDNEAKAVRIR
jgi:cbb3-type cytochrome oxidase maturation protein